MMHKRNVGVFEEIQEHVWHSARVRTLHLTHNYTHLFYEYKHIRI